MSSLLALAVLLGQGGPTSLVRAAADALCGTVQVVPSPNTVGLQNSALNAVAGRAADDVWAVGYLTTHWDGSRWRPVPRPAGILQGVAARAVDDAWAVGFLGGQGAVIQHWDGQTWQEAPALDFNKGQSSLNAVATLAPDNAWAVGYYPASTTDTLITHWDGHAWGVVTSPNRGTNNMLNGVAGAAPNDVWAVGGYLSDIVGHAVPLLEHWTGGQWSVVAAPAITASMQLYAVSARATNDVWAVGDGGLALHWNGTAWTTQAIPLPTAGTQYRFTAVTARAANDVWAVGHSLGEAQHNLIAHWNGTAWRLVASPDRADGTNTLAGVVAVAGADAWAVGGYIAGSYLAESVILHWNGTYWTHTLSPNVTRGDNALYGVATLAPNDLWAVGTAGQQMLALHWSGNRWSLVPTPVLEGGAMQAVAGAATDDVWAVGGRYYLHWDGTRWAVAAQVDANTTLGSVSAQTRTDAWAVGSFRNCAAKQCVNQGIINHWDGSAWRPSLPPDYQNVVASSLNAITALAANEAWAVGSRILHWDGQTWTQVAAPVGDLHAVAALSANNLWAVGATLTGTLIMHSDGTTWAPVPSPSVGDHAALTAVAAVAADDVWAAGTYQSESATQTLLLHWDGTAWTQVSTPNPGHNPALAGLVATGGAVWAVGSQTVDSTTQTLIARYTCTTCSAPYSDIAGNPFADYIRDLCCRGIVAGNPDGTFGPYADASRGTLAEWVVRARALPLNMIGGPHFRDVAASDPRYPYIETAYNAGIVSGYAEGTFHPDAPVTRGQMSKMVVNSFDWAPNTSGGPHFRDVDAANPFYAPIETIYAHGLVSGYDCGAGCREFRWGSNNTRGQLSKVLANALAP